MNKMTNKKNHSGFTLVEIIIVVGVMAILTSLTAPAIVQMIQQRDEEIERQVLDEMIDALARYAQDNNSIPNEIDAENPDNENWADLLARYTNYSPNQLRTDTWGQPRAYITHPEEEVFLDTEVTINYATILSSGVNREAEAGTHIALGAIIDGVAVYGDASANNWWANQVNRLVAFSEVEVGGDDLMVKFTNYQTVVDNYNTTLERFGTVADALGAYSQAKYTEALVFDNALPDGHPSKDPNINRRIYFPPSLTKSGTDRGIYSPFVTNDMANYSFGSDNRVFSRSNNTLRRNEMISLMRLLGLPDSYCCSALERFESGGQTFEVPFHYFSNPRPRGPVRCGARPSTGGNNLPPRLALNVTNDTCG